MTTTKAAPDAKQITAFLGVRVSIWGVLFVLICAGIGAALGGSIYAPSTTLGAAVGVMLSSSVIGCLGRTGKK